MGLALRAAQHYSLELTQLFLGVPLLAVIAVSAAGAAVYGVAAIATGALRISDVTSSLKRS